MPGFLPDYLYGNISLEGQSQTFLFGQTNGLSQFQIKNNYTPTSLNPCQNYVELINVNSSGYRLNHLTNSTNTRGSLTIESFINGTIPGTPLITFNESGPMVLSPPTSNAIQIKNNTNSIPLQFYNSTGSNYVAFQAGSLSTNTTWTLPTTDSTGMQYLVSNGSSVLSWFSGANYLAKYIIQTADATLPNAQVLGSLTTGLLKNTTTTGVLTISVPGTDYYSLNNPTKLIDTGGSSNNVAMGKTALSNGIFSGSQNHVFGNGGALINTGNFNHIFGSTANNLTSGSANIVIGDLAAENMGIASDNVLIGDQCSRNITGSSQNIFIGTLSGRGLQSGSGLNVGIGYQAGYSSSFANGLMASCVFIGGNSQPGGASLTNAIAIGANAIVAASNCMSLGNGVTVGINETTPTYAGLCVVGGIQNITNEDSVIRASSSSNSAKIEINNTAAGGRLYELRSDSAGSAFNIVDRTSSVNRLTIDSSGQLNVFNNIISNNSSSTIPDYIQLGNATNYVQFGYDGTNTRTFINFVGGSNASLNFQNSGTNLAYLTSGGLFGVGTSPTQAKIVASGGVQNVVNEDSVIRAISSSLSAKIEIQNTTASTGRLYEIRSGSNGIFDITDRTGLATRFKIDTSGNVGINTTPSFTLDVGGPIRGTRLMGNGNTPTFAIQTNAGSGATASIAGTESSGVFTLTAGTTGLSTGSLVIFTLSSAMSSVNYGVIFTPWNTTTALINTFATPTLSTTTFGLSTGTALTASLTYKWNYVIIGG